MLMRFFPFCLPWRLAQALVTTYAYRRHLRRLATSFLVLDGLGHARFIDGYGDHA